MPPNTILIPFGSDGETFEVLPRGGVVKVRVKRPAFGAESGMTLSRSEALSLAAALTRAAADGLKSGTIADAFAALRAAGGDAWDGIADPVAYLKETTGD